MQILRGRTTRIHSLAISPDSRYVVAESNTAVHCWDLDEPKSPPRSLIMREGPVYAMQFTSASIIFVLKERFWYRHDLATSDVRICKLPSRIRARNGIIHPGGDLLKTEGSENSVENFRVTPVGFEPVGSAGTIPELHWLIGFNPAGDRYLVHATLARPSLNGPHLFDSATDTLVTSLELPRSTSLSDNPWPFSPDGHSVYANAYNALLAFDCVRGGLPFANYETPESGHHGAIALHSDGRMVATVENEQAVTFRDAETLQPMRTYDFKMPRVTCVAFTPDGTRCVLGNSRGKVLLFDVE